MATGAQSRANALPRAGGDARIDGWPEEIVGNGAPVPLLGGASVPYAYLDNAASTPPLRAVVDAVNAFIPWYSSVHRGTGYKSRVATAAYEQARERARQFVHAGDDQTVLFVKNTTEGLNRLARLAQQRGAIVFVSVMEHHANMLPWRFAGRAVRHFQADDQGVIDEDDLARQLAAAPPGPKLVAIAGAYNVSGYVPPMHRIARVAHEYGAELVVDAAQLAPHRRIDMRGAVAGEEIDYLVFSAHKVYAPFGSGILVAPTAVLNTVDPALVGGGIVDLVLLDEVVWNELPDREEAGSPNVVGAVALGAALTRLEELGREALEAQEHALTTYLLERLAGVPGLRILGPAVGEPRVGVASFVLGDRSHDQVAAALSYEHGIGVRSGCFCAHPGVFRMLDVPDDVVDVLRLVAREHKSRADRRPRAFGAVRASLGLQNTQAEADRLVNALTEIATEGPHGTYRVDERTGDYVPEGWSDGPPAALRAMVADRW